MAFPKTIDFWEIFCFKILENPRKVVRRGFL